MSIQAKPYFKSVLNNKIIVEGLSNQILTVDYAKNDISPERSGGGPPLVAQCDQRITLGIEKFSGES